MFKMISAVYSHLEKMADLNNDVTEKADILYLNENIHCIILLLIRVILKTDKLFLFYAISNIYSPLKYSRA